MDILEKSVLPVLGTGPRFLQPSHYADYAMPAILYGKREEMRVQT